MKRYQFYLLTILIFLMSCAEEGPLRMGKIECEVEVSYITPTTVNIKFSYPQTNDNPLQMPWNYQTAYLSETPLQNNMHYSTFNWVCSDSYNSDRRNGLMFFSNLKPNTKYYLITEADINLNLNQEEAYYSSTHYYTEVSFTTAQEGDYSGLGEFKFVDNVELNTYDFKYKYFTIIKLCLPSSSGWNYSSNYACADLQASPNPNMTDEIYGIPIFYNSSYIEVDGLKYFIPNNYHGNEKELYFIFPLLENKKYYMKYEGKMNLEFGSHKLETDDFCVDGSVDVSGI